MKIEPATPVPGFDATRRQWPPRMPESDAPPPYDAQPDGRGAHDDVIRVQEPAPGEQPAPIVITATRFVWRNPSQIPPRQWLYGRSLIRGFVSATIAPGGVGKSSLSLVDALAMVTCKPLLGVRPANPLRVWYWSGEDPNEETERRLAAACLFYRIGSDDIGGRLFVDSGRQKAICIAKADRSSFTIATPVMNALVAEIRARQIDVLIIDPFVSSHQVSENDNGAIDAVVKTWAAIADATGCAIELVHHTRKNGGAELTAEDGRGASAMNNAARAVRVLNVMTKDEAAKAGVENPLEYFRADNGKSNLAPRSDRANWYRLVSEPLGNGRDGYAGDEVGVVTKWAFPDAAAGATLDDLQKAQASIAEGEWGENVQATDWAGYAVAKALDIDINAPAGKARVKALLAMWVASNALKVDRRHDNKKGRLKPFIIVGQPA